MKMFFHIEFVKNVMENEEPSNGKKICKVKFWVPISNFVKNVMETKSLQIVKNICKVKFWDPIIGIRCIHYQKYYLYTKIFFISGWDL